MAALAVLTLCFGDLHHRLGFFSERAELRFPKMAVGTTYILLGAPSIISRRLNIYRCMTGNLAVAISTRLFECFGHLSHLGATGFEFGRMKPRRCSCFEGLDGLR